MYSIYYYTLRHNAVFQYWESGKINKTYIHSVICIIIIMLLLIQIKIHRLKRHRRDNDSTKMIYLWIDCNSWMKKGTSISQYLFIKATRFGGLRCAQSSGSNKNSVYYYWFHEQLWKYLVFKYSVCVVFFLSHSI